jgi:tyrosine decarboxylase
MQDKMDVNALFLGPKAENLEFFKEMLGYLMDDYARWREDYQPDDPPAVSTAQQQASGFQASIQRTREALVDLAGRLQVSSVPWFSPRYLGHMNADTLMAANLGYMLTLLYNPNNCAYEGSPATTALEIEVGRQLARLLGYDPARSWGHVTSGGTVANYEGLWVARNLKSLPLAVREVLPALTGDRTEWQLLNLPPGRILDLLDRVKAAGKLDAVRARSARGAGLSPGRLGKILVPQTKHYSWTKAADILGLGLDSLEFIRVDERFRMDICHLRETIDRLVADRIPVLAVVAVVGTTEEGAVDPVHEVVRLREEYEKRGVSFYLHVDAAYGGYARAIFLDEQGRFLERAELPAAFRRHAVFSAPLDWPEPDVHAAFQAMGEADSITIDPHKMGYVPYAAGAVVLKDRRVLDLISYFAAYVFEQSEDNPMLLGSYILEGSKAGATVASVWAAHRTVPLDLRGYGRLIGASIEGAHRFYEALQTTPPYEKDGRRFRIHPLVRPDFNMVDFAVHEEGNPSLAEMNALNQRLWELCSHKSGPLYSTDFITSKTALTREEYGDAPGQFVASLGIPEAEWARLGRVYVLRSCVLTPYLAQRTTFVDYWGTFLSALGRALCRIV